MQKPSIIFLNGASGVGKTTTAELLTKEPDIGWLHPDSLWNTPDMEQNELTRKCVESALGYSTPIVLIDSQLQYRFMQTAFQRYKIEKGMQILLDCSDDVRRQRLIGRGCTQGFIEEMVPWATFLRNDAVKNGVSIISTTNADITHVAESVSAIIGTVI